MPSYAFVAPILPGKLDAWRKYVQEMKTTRNAEFVASRKKANVSVEEVWLQRTPMGDFAVVHMEAADPGAVFGRFATSTDPFDVWFREKVLGDVHGMASIDPSTPLNERII